MTGNHESLSGHFELSQQELEGLMKALAQELIQHGEISDNPNVWPEVDEGTTPRLFSYSLPASFIKEVVYPNEENLIVEGGKAVYAAPYKIEPDEVLIAEGVTITYSSRLAGTDIDCVQWVNISRDGLPYRAMVDTEYSRDGVRISPNDLQADKEMSDEHIAELIDDVFALERQLTLDDAEKIRTIIDHIAHS